MTLALYKAYGELTSAGTARRPFLLDILGDTRVGLTETATAAAIGIRMELVHPTAGARSGLGVRAYLEPLRPLTDLHLASEAAPGDESRAHRSST